MKKIIGLFIILSCFISTISAQVGINEDGSQPNASALLDVKSTNKGILIPRMTTTQRTAISSPATGLMVFDNTTASFWFYNSSTWTEIKAGTVTSLQDADNDTKIQVEESADEDKIRFDLGGSERVVIEQSTTGRTLINLPNNNFNTFLGQDAGQVTNGQNNGFIGYQAGYNNTTGAGNIFYGYQAGFSNTTGYDNVFSGQNVGRSNTTGILNVFNGAYAGYSNTTGNNNAFNGARAGYSNTTGNTNVFNGFKSGYSNTTGSGNVFSGTQAGFSNTTGVLNVFNGAYAGYANTTGYDNVFSGQNAGRSNTTGVLNVFNGAYAGYSNTTGNNNTFTGTRAGYSNTTGYDNVFSGQNAGRLNTTGILNVFSGAYAGYSNTTGNNNTFNGTRAGYSNTTGNNNTFNGTRAGYSNTTGNNNLFNGYQAGYSNTIGIANVYNGYQAGYSNTTGYDNTFNGFQAGFYNTTGQKNHFSGAYAGYSNMTGSFNTFNGYRAGYSNTTGYDNAFSGYQAGYSNTTGAFNTFYGYRAGFSNTTGTSNVFLGHKAGYYQTGDNKLYIENSISNTPLIYGDFANDTVKIYGTLGIKNAYTFPIVDGTVGQVLQTDGAGNTAWASPTPNTDNQKTDVFQLNGTNLELSIENDGIATQSIDLSSLNATKTIIADADNDTKIQVEESADEDKVRIDLAGEERLVIEKSANGYTLLQLPNNRFNTFLGEGAGQATVNQFDVGFRNNFIGYQAGYVNTIGYDNVFNGYQAGKANIDGYGNVFSGFIAGSKNTSGYNNVFTGYDAGQQNTMGCLNLFSGSFASNNNTTGNNNTYIGTAAGFNNINGSNNILLGNHSGYNETGSNKLYIENSNSATPLIYGDFANDIIKIHGTLGIKNAYTFPIVDGTVGQVLQTDGAGNTAWASPIPNTDNQKTDVFQLNVTNLELSIENDGIATQSIDLSSLNSTKTIIADVDNDTKIQVEESADEDKIRFDLGGSEQVVMEKSSHGNTMLSFPNNNGNLLLGNQAGSNEASSNKLYIENSTSATPLIYGEFDNDLIKINGSFTSTGIVHPNAGVYFPHAFAPDATYIGTAGNFISFAHVGFSEDFLGYANNNFYFRDSPNGGDNAQPSVYAASFPTYSSRRWKHNIQNMDNAISIIQQLQGVTYTWNEDYGGFEDFGFIAEEVNKVLPQIAKKGKDGEVDGVEYGKITPYLVEAMKEQQIIIENQNQKIQQLEQQVQKINKLESMMKQLQAQLSPKNN